MSGWYGLTGRKTGAVRCDRSGSCGIAARRSGRVVSGDTMNTTRPDGMLQGIVDNSAWPVGRQPAFIGAIWSMPVACRLILAAALAVFCSNAVARGTTSPEGAKTLGALLFIVVPVLVGWMIGYWIVEKIETWWIEVAGLGWCLWRPVLLGLFAATPHALIIVAGGDPVSPKVLKPAIVGWWIIGAVVVYQIVRETLWAFRARKRRIARAVTRDASPKVDPSRCVALEAPRSTVEQPTTCGSPDVRAFANARDAGKPRCPLCNGKMVERLARRGRGAGCAFWGCERFPQCRGTRPI